jgi:hypothetical protein
MTDKQPYDPARAVRWKKNVLDCLLSVPELWSKAGSLSADDFFLDDHRKVFRAITDLHDHGCKADIEEVGEQLGESMAAAVGALIDGAVPENFDSYVRRLRESTREGRFYENLAKLGEAKTLEDRRAWLDVTLRGLESESDAQNWLSIFHTAEECENAPPLRFAISGFLQEAGVTLIGGLAGHGKTLLMLAMAKALLEERPLFGYEPFSIPRPAQRVLYLIPESSLGPFWSRIKLFQLQEYVRTDRLLVRTLSSREQVSLKDPRLLKAAEGADVFLDTAVRFMDGSENDVESTRPFVQTLFDLLTAGARTITGAHHSPKGFEAQDYMGLENVLRGSGDIGAGLSTAWGVRQIDPARNQLFIQNIKPRDFVACEPFILEARPHLDIDGQFKMLAAPGEAGELSEHLTRRGKAGRPATESKTEKMAEAADLRAQGVSIRETAEKLGVSKSCVSKWLFEYDRSVH